MLLHFYNLHCFSIVDWFLSYTHWGKSAWSCEPFWSLPWLYVIYHEKYIHIH